MRRMARTEDNRFMWSGWLEHPHWHGWIQRVSARVATAEGERQAEIESAIPVREIRARGDYLFDEREQEMRERLIQFVEKEGVSFLPLSAERQ